MDWQLRYASKYLKANISDSDSYFNSYVKQGIVPKGTFIARMIFISDRTHLSYRNVLIVNQENELQHSFDIKLIKRDKPENSTHYPSTPYSPRVTFNKEDENKLYLPDFYFKDL